MPLITSAFVEILDRLKGHLNDVFKLKNLCDLCYFLGLEFARSSQGIFISQRHYVLPLLKDPGLLTCKPVHCPMGS